MRSQTQKDSLAASVAAARESVRIANDRYQGGGRTVFEVYYFQSILTQQEDQLAVAQGQIALDLIAVYRALRGGWEMRLSRDTGAIGANVAQPGPGTRRNDRPRRRGAPPGP